MRELSIRVTSELPSHSKRRQRAASRTAQGRRKNYLIVSDMKCDKIIYLIVSDMKCDKSR